MRSWGPALSPPLSERDQRPLCPAKSRGPLTRSWEPLQGQGEFGNTFSRVTFTGLSLKFRFPPPLAPAGSPYLQPGRPRAPGLLGTVPALPPQGPELGLLGNGNGSCVTTAGLSSGLNGRNYLRAEGPVPRWQKGGKGGRAPGKNNQSSLVLSAGNPRGRSQQPKRLRLVPCHSQRLLVLPDDRLAGQALIISLLEMSRVMKEKLGNFRGQPRSQSSPPRVPLSSEGM